MLMYHGSPWGGLKSFDDTKTLPVFFTREERVAREYAFHKTILAAQRDPGTGAVKKPTVYRVEVNGVSPFDMRKHDHLAFYKTWRVELIKAAGDDDEDVYHDFPPHDSEGFLMSYNGLPSYGYVRGLWKMLKGKSSGKFDSIWIDEGSQGISLALFEVKGKTEIVSTVYEGQVPPMASVFRT